MSQYPVNLSIDRPETTRQLARQLSQALNQGKLAILLGSGISQFSPSNVPTASYVSREMQGLVIDRFGEYAPRENIHWGIAGMPFEIFMSRLVDMVGVDIAEEFISKLTAIHEPNPVHRQIGALVDKCISEGLALTVLTTNYDLGIENAVNEKIVPIVTEEDISRQTGSNGVYLFKPHGSIGVKGSLVFDSEREYGLDEWKRNFLQRQLDGKTLVILGYSGWDLDISLALSECGMTAVFWSCYQRQDSDGSSWSPGRRGVLTTGRRYSLILNSSEDKTIQKKILKVLESVCPRLGDVQVSSHYLQTRLTTSLESLPPGVLDAWLAWVITRAGFGHIGMAVKDLVERVPIIPQTKKIEHEATCYYYQGSHARAAQLQRRAASAPENDPHQRAYHRGNEASYWARGNYSLMSALTIIRGLLEVAFASYDKGVRASDTIYMTDQLIHLWPLQWLMHTKVAKTLAMAKLRSGKGKRAFEDEGPLRRAASIGVGDQEEGITRWHYEWLGEPARLINYQRIEARISLDQFRRQRQWPDFDVAVQQGIISAQASFRVGDPARLGKAHLLLAEIAHEAYMRTISLQSIHCSQRTLRASGWRRVAYDLARKGWYELRASQTWLPSIYPGIWLCFLSRYVPQVGSGKRLSNMLISASARWVGA